MARIPILFLLGLLCTLLALAPLSAAESEAQWFDYKRRCILKPSGRNIIGAIDRLCAHDLHVPGNRARFGEKFDKMNRVAILPNSQCLRDGRMKDSDRIWVPQYWCVRQFWKTCAEGNAKGRAWRFFGGKGCQYFGITDFTV